MGGIDLVIFNHVLGPVTARALCKFYVSVTTVVFYKQNALKSFNLGT